MLEDFFLGKPFFRGYVSFREGRFKMSSRLMINVLFGESGSFLISRIVGWRCQKMLMHAPWNQISTWKDRASSNQGPWIFAVYRDWNTTQSHMGLFHKALNKDLWYFYYPVLWGSQKAIARIPMDQPVKWYVSSGFLLPLLGVMWQNYNQTPIFWYTTEV